jgi:hypothetical protein
MNVWMNEYVCVCLCAYVINMNFCQDDRLYLANYILLIQDRKYIACVVDLLLKVVNLSFIWIKVLKRKFFLLNLHFSGQYLHCCSYAA